MASSTSLVLRDVCSRYPLRLPSPAMFRIVFEICEERASELVAITRFDPTGLWGAAKVSWEDEIAFARALCPLFTVPDFWLHALAAMQVICRCQSFLSTPEVSAEEWGLPPSHRLWHLMALVCKTQQSHPRRAAVPWLLCLYEWAAVDDAAGELPFHKMMLAPAVAVVRCKEVPPAASDLTTIIQLTTTLLKRHEGFSDRPSSVVLGTTLPLPSDDPRCAYGVYIHIVLNYPHLKDVVSSTVRTHLGNAGMWELELARTRVLGLLAAQQMLVDDPFIFTRVPETFPFNDTPHSIVHKQNVEAEKEIKP